MFLSFNSSLSGDTSGAGTTNPSLLFFVGFILLDLYFFVECFAYHCFFCPSSICNFNIFINNVSFKDTSFSN